MGSKQHSKNNQNSTNNQHSRNNQNFINNQHSTNNQQKSSDDQSSEESFHFNDEIFSEDNSTDTNNASSKAFKSVGKKTKLNSNNFSTVKLPVEAIDEEDAGFEEKEVKREIKSAW